MVHVYVIDYDEDDPSKCTGKRMVRLGLAEFARRPKGITLDPFSRVTLGIEDRETAEKYGITVIDASWNRFDPAKVPRSSFSRRLPILVAGNPINYAIAYKLSSVEAVFATLYILEWVEEAMAFLKVNKWMKTFYDLNRELLETYRGKSRQEIEAIEEEILQKYREGPQL
ncbi:MAG: DUF367 family protein [Thermoprotei archaeon]